MCCTGPMPMGIRPRPQRGIKACARHFSLSIADVPVCAAAFDFAPTASWPDSSGRHIVVLGHAVPWVVTTRACHGNFARSRICCVRNGEIVTASLLRADPRRKESKMKHPESALLEKYSEEQMVLATQRLGGDAAAATIVCQEVRKAVARRLRGDGEPIKAIWPYLCRATVNACYRKLRRHREHVQLGKAADSYVIAESLDPAIAAMLADVRLTSERIVREYRGSPSLEIFRLRYADGFSTPEISARLGLSQSTVKRHSRAILVLLRKKLRDHR